MELFKDLFLALGNYKLVHIQPNCVWLAAGLLKIIFVDISAAPPKPSVHHFLVVHH